LRPGEAEQFAREPGSRVRHKPAVAQNKIGHQDRQQHRDSPEGAARKAGVTKRQSNRDTNRNSQEGGAPRKLERVRNGRPESGAADDVRQVAATFHPTRSDQYRKRYQHQASGRRERKG
jgi:predicted phage gp36 major capsid-like protein